MGSVAITGEDRPWRPGLACWPRREARRLPGRGLPQGNFVLPEGAPVRPLFITGGSGIARDEHAAHVAARGAMPDVAHVYYPLRTGRHLRPRLAELARAFPRYRLAIVTT